MLMEIFKDNDNLSKALSEKIANILKEKIKVNNQISLILSGGTTPTLLYQELAKTTLDWEKVKITTCDEHILSQDNPHRNDYLIKKTLLTKNASKAKFFSLLNENLNSNSSQNILLPNSNIDKNFSENADILILGMGLDGHTASLFPDAIEKEKIFYGLNNLYQVTSKSAKTLRITFGLQRLLKSENIFLYIIGNDKLAVLANAINADNFVNIPVKAFLFKKNVKIFWAPN